MKTHKQTLGGRTIGFTKVALCLLLPALLGGCPEFRNESLNAVEAAFRGVLNAAVDLFFDQFRVQ